MYKVVLIEYFMGTSLHIIDSEEDLQKTKETFPKVEIMLETTELVEAIRYTVEHQELVKMNKFGKPDEN